MRHTHMLCLPSCGAFAHLPTWLPSFLRRPTPPAYPNYRASRWDMGAAWFASICALPRHNTLMAHRHLPRTPVPHIPRYHTCLLPPRPHLHLILHTHNRSFIVRFPAACSTDHILPPAACLPTWRLLHVRRRARGSYVPSGHQSGVTGKRAAARRRMRQNTEQRTRA